MQTSNELTTQGYRDGVAACLVDGAPESVMSPREVKLAVEQWRIATTDHGHTSYWGAGHCRAMVAYWLAVRRQRRATDARFLTDDLYRRHVASSRTW